MAYKPRTYDSPTISYTIMWNLKVAVFFYQYEYCMNYSETILII